MRGLLSWLLWVPALVAAVRELKANSLVTCDGTTGVTVKDFSILYNHETRNIAYNASVNVALDGYVYADIDIYIYGLLAIQTRLNPCTSSALKELCPLSSGRIDIDSNSDLSSSITSKLPGVAFTVPDIDAFAVFRVKNYTTGEQLSCLFVEIQNTRSVEQTSVKWVTAVLSGVGLLVSAIMVVMGTSVDAQSISAVTVMMVQYFQSMVLLDMEAVQRVPPIASAWSNNLAWSVGCVYAKFLAKIYRWYISATGGTPATYHLYTVNYVLTQKLRKRALDVVEHVSPRSREFLAGVADGWLTPEGRVAKVARGARSEALSSDLPEIASTALARGLGSGARVLTDRVFGVVAKIGERAAPAVKTAASRRAPHALAKRVSAPREFPVTLDQSAYLIVYRGIERLAYESGLEVTSVVMVSYTIFIFVCVCVVFVYACLWLLARLMTRRERAHRESTPEQFDLKQPFADESSARGSTSVRGSMSAQSADLPSANNSMAASIDTRSRVLYLFESIPTLCKGTLLKLWLVAFPSIFVFSFWEWTKVDSAAVVVVSVFMLLVCALLIILNSLRVWIIAKRSQEQTGTAAFLLYNDQQTLHRYGYLYTMFSTEYYWFGLVYVAYNFVKVCFVAFSQSSGQTQALALFIIELAMCIAVGVCKPFLTRAVNGIQITTHSVITVNAMFFLFFSNLMTQNLIVNGVMGVVFFILNAAYSTVLLLYIIIYSLLCWWWHSRGKATRREHQARDQRDSFIIENGGATAKDVDEFNALGSAAEAGQDIDGNPFDAPYEERSDPFSDTRLNTMTSEYSGVFGDGHRATESQSSFEPVRDEGEQEMLGESKGWRRMFGR